MNFYKTVLIIVFVLFGHSLLGLNIRIIESQSANAGHTMDNVWSAVATSMGHTPTISPQTTLDNNGFFASTDFLIISSGIIAISPARVNIILQFVQSGKPVYIQSEYLSSYTSNMAFQSIVTSLGGSFNWTTPFTGNLAPMTVLGTFATTNNAVPTVSTFWYSYAGLGDCNMYNYLSYGGSFHGFQYVPANPAFGSISTNADQDWVRNSLSLPLMQNIITLLINPPIVCSVLPVELLAFNATAENNSVVKCEWTTASETNNDYFAIERSIDGITFERIGITKGAGTSSHANHYEFYDNQPLPGNSYYRLKQVDLNANYNFSNTESVNIGSTEIINIWPNPTQSDLTISFTVEQNTEFAIELYNVVGEQISFKNLTIPNGRSQIEFPIEHLSSGYYFFKFRFLGKELTQKIIIE